MGGSASFNTAVGAYAAGGNVSGSQNVAVGYTALSNNATGGQNTAIGPYSLLSNNSGNGNIGIGSTALYSNVSGGANVAIGNEALYASTGGYNIAVGYQAGKNATTGINNIYIGNPGVAADSYAIRIGTTGVQTQTYIAGAIHGDGSGLTNLTIGGLPTDLLRLHLITYLGGCDSCSILTTADNQKLIYQNLLGAPLTLLSITCYSDTGTPSIDIQRDNNGTLANVTASPIGCSTLGGVTSAFTVGTLNSTDKLNFLMTSPDGAAHRVTVIVKTTL
jgi:hypothetical protein